MRKQFIVNGFLTILIIILLSGCTDTIKESNITGKTYVYEKEGFGSDFAISIDEDGTFNYFEGNFSSYIGVGEWTLDGNILCLSDDEKTGYAFVNYFKVDGDNLIFQAEKSSNFLYIEVSDGDRFSAASQENLQGSFQE